MVFNIDYVLFVRLLLNFSFFVVYLLFTMKNRKILNELSFGYTYRFNSKLNRLSKWVILVCFMFKFLTRT